MESKLTYEDGPGSDADEPVAIPSKKFINAADCVVPQSLEGLSVVNKDFIELYYPEGRVECEIPIVALKPSLLNNTNVKIMCGGASGHEPAHAGYVCP